MVKCLGLVLSAVHAYGGLLKFKKSEIALK